ncbi:MAG TPA: DUF3108 domain-containing protein [Thermoanaerobaculia bacterium]|nr:DUF3108 domain-containing protein [Thermoanaerobaculia bacterium]
MMSRRIRRIGLLGLLLLLLPQTAAPAHATCEKNGANEQLRYTWRLRGGLAWLAGFRFPTSGAGELETFRESGQEINSKLMITGSSGGDDFYLYQSEMDRTGDRTLVSYHGYAFGKKERSERTLFDYVKRLARIHKKSGERAEDRVRPIPSSSMRDILTGIYYIRQNATVITKPIETHIYSDGSVYPVLFRPLGTETVEFNGESIQARAFMITAARGSEKRWPGGVRLVISDDERRVPLRIEIRRSLATLQLDLQTIERCGLRVGS